MVDKITKKDQVKYQNVDEIELEDISQNKNDVSQDYDTVDQQFSTDYSSKNSNNIGDYEEEIKDEGNN